ncbi:RecB family exonuclease [Nocardia asiatica]|uniref:RecB family exonuclease n=1 Tax=Nocardia asiatica TaxID=209252 RepID=UPI0002F59EB1|nr:PD-(D/E)XK nuclease family protein [Nocardia asiatica]
MSSTTTIAVPAAPADPAHTTPDQQQPKKPQPLWLSPSRSSDFKTCPLYYRLRAIDKITEPTSPAAARGSVVHAVLDALFARPPHERTPPAAAALLEELWPQLAAKDQALADAAGEDVPAFLARVRKLVAAYFELEDPTTVVVTGREQRVRVGVGDTLVLIGIIDRLDELPGGGVGIVDYKTGRPPSERGEQEALFQLKFYALILWRLHGEIPRTVRLLYPGHNLHITYRPDPGQLAGFERTVMALGAAITKAKATQNFPPRRSWRCGWCKFKPLCPAFGGTPPPYPTTTTGSPRS